MSLTTRLKSFAVRGVIWRKYLDWAAENLPFYLYPVFVFFWSFFFFAVARPARRAILRNLTLVNPGGGLANTFRAFGVFRNFAWTIAESAIYRINEVAFHFDLAGEENLRALAASNGAIVLTAHMGSYDLGAALFAEKFNREIRMVRAKEADPQSAEHLDNALREAGSGGIKVAYNTGDAALSFDLLHALRAGEIVSLQGDRVIGPVATIEVKLFGKRVQLPAGPFNLALVTSAPIYPLFIIRRGYRHYEISALTPTTCSRSARGRDMDLRDAAQIWATTLEPVIANAWSQWYAFTPVW